MRYQRASDPLASAPLVPKAIDNSQVVRELDPSSSRDIWLLIGLVAVLVGGLVLYAWPNLELRHTDVQREQMSRERERLVEENRKLRLERAMLENLRRVEAIATRDLGLKPPEPERVIVVDRPEPVAPEARLARDTAAEPRR